MPTKGFWIPIELYLLKDITMQEKLLLIEILNLSMLDKGCIASNNHFSELFQIKKEAVSRSLNNLQKKGYLDIEIKNGSRNFDRKITINKMLFDYKQNVIAPLTKCSETKENKTINKTKNTYDSFIQFLKDKSKYKTKITKTKQGEKLFKQIEDKKQLVKDYLLHQEVKGEYAVRITSYMEDYETVYKHKEKENSKFGEWSE